MRASVQRSPKPTAGDAIAPEDDPRVLRWAIAAVLAVFWGCVTMAVRSCAA